MESLADSDLLRACVERLRSRLDAREESALRGWAEETVQRAAPLVSALLARRETEWERLMLTHRAHRHPWYDELAHRVSIQEFAAFLLENWAFPAFLPLLERTKKVQICDQGRAAIRRNLEDEQVPVPHAELMRRLIEAVKAKAGKEVRLECYPSLVDRTLVFYYGYYSDPWHLVGSLYAMEVMAHYRVTRMGVGLVRLGIEPADLEFIRIHSVCDEDHARDWREGVIAPSVRIRPPLRVSIAEGIVTCLETSARYLDDLVARAHRGRRAVEASAARSL
ncbi:MAG: iron-containing redox enzyme family protein [Gammaproteobacteria bacterium]